jgi:flagellar hook-basal body complex protein FliE
MTADIGSILRLDRGPSEFAPRVAAPSGGPSFTDALTSVLREGGQLDRAADARVQALAAGQPVEPHELMMAVEQANMALDLVIEIRNRLMDAYQELIRTQV